MKEKKTLSFLIIALGLWQLAFPLTFFHVFCWDCSAMVLSDAISGLVLIALGVLSCLSLYPIPTGWLVGLVGLWLQCAPLLFWAFSPLIYLNDTVIGIVAIIFCFQLTKDPVKTSSIECPRGWSYNPSAWKHRLPTVGLAILAWFFARYMAAYQLGYIPYIWDPFFTDGTFSVITSDVSKSFPVSDAGLGALCYTLEALLGWQGDHRRWATMPWLVFSFAFLVIPVGIISIVLIILQPVIVGAWCTWCLATAFCMLLMIVLTAGEFAATLQFLNDSVQRGESFWHVFWKGGDVPETKTKAPAKSHSIWGAWGISIPWSLPLGLIGGILLMILPSYFNYQDKLSTSDYIVGPVLFSISVIAMAEIFRILRYAFVGLGAWILMAPWVLSNTPAGGAVVSHIVIGTVLMLSIFLCKSKIKERYGPWESLMI